MASSKTLITKVITPDDAVFDGETKTFTMPFTFLEEQNIGVVATVTKTSGTVGGTIECFGSWDGTNYVALTSTTTGIKSGEVEDDSVEIADATGTYQFLFADAKFKHYKVVITQDEATGVGSVACTVYYRQSR